MIERQSDGSLLLPTGSVLGDDLQEGSVLVGPGDELTGYFDLVTGVNAASDGAVVLTVEPATLFDVYEELDLTVEPDFAVADAASNPLSSHQGTLRFSFDNDEDLTAPVQYAIDGSIVSTFHLRLDSQPPTQNGRQRNYTVAFSGGADREISTRLLANGLQNAIDQQIELESVTYAGIPLPEIAELRIVPRISYSAQLIADGTDGLLSQVTVSDQSTESFTASYALDVSNRTVTETEPLFAAESISAICTDEAVQVPGDGSIALRLTIRVELLILGSAVFDYAQIVGHEVHAGAAATPRLTVERSLELAAGSGVRMTRVGHSTPLQEDYRLACVSADAPQVHVLNSVDGQLVPASYAPGSTVQVRAELVDLLQPAADALLLRWGRDQADLDQQLSFGIDPTAVVEPTEFAASFAVPAEATVGDLFVQVVATDGFGNMTADSGVLSARVDSSVGPPSNQPPLVADQTVAEVAIGSERRISLSVSDPDAGPEALAVSLGGASGGSVALDPAEQFIAIYTAPDTAGRYTFTYSASDGAATSTATITVDVVDTAVGNLPPELGSQPAIEVRAGSSITFSVVASDPDLGPESIQVVLANVVDGPGAVTVGDPTPLSLTYTPPIDSAGETAQIDFVVSDGADDSVVGVIDVTILARSNNAPPVARDKTYDNIRAGSTFILSLPVTDEDSDPEDYFIVLGQATSPDVTIYSHAGLRVQWELPSQTGSYSFDYAVSDGVETSNSATITVNVVAGPVDGGGTPIGDPPTTEPLEVTTSQLATEIEIALPITDPDTDDEDLTVSIGAVSAGTARLSASTPLLLLYTTPPNLGQATIDYTVTDGQNSLVPGQVTVQVVEP